MEASTTTVARPQEAGGQAVRPAEACSDWGSLLPEHWGHVSRWCSCCVLQGVIQHSTINNLAFGRNIDETLRVLQALKYVQVSCHSKAAIEAPHTSRPTQRLSCKRRAAALPSQHPQHLSAPTLQWRWPREKMVG